MLESMLYIQGKAVYKPDITFRTSSTTATTITTSGLGPGFTTQYSVDGSALTPTGTSFSIPAGSHEVTLKLTVTTGTYLSMNPFSNILTEVTDWEDFQLPEVRFQSCSKLTKVPDHLPVAVTNMSNMFQNCTSFNQNISSWNVGNVTDMYGVFGGCTSFNQNISSWNVSNVTNIAYMFRNCTSFNQNLSSMVFKSTVSRANYDQGATAWNAAYRPKFTG